MTNETKELEKKHLCSYLPYELKVSNQFGIHKVLGLRSKSSSNNNLMISYKLHGDVVWGYSYQNKPLLRPMSDLYKEINGEVGIDVIGKMFEPNGVLNFEDGNYYYGWNTHVCDDYQGYEIGWIDEAGWFGIFFDTYDYDNQTENFTGDYLPYNRNVAEYLDRKHFDWRYDLIIKGLAIDKNTIKEWKNY